MMFNWFFGNRTTRQGEEKWAASFMATFICMFATIACTSLFMVGLAAYQGMWMFCAINGFFLVFATVGVLFCWAGRQKAFRDLDARLERER